MGAKHKEIADNLNEWILKYFKKKSDADILAVVLYWEIKKNMKKNIYLMKIHISSGYKTIELVVDLRNDNIKFFYNDAAVIELFNTISVDKLRVISSRINVKFFSN